ncbi:hypothetical protein Taro_000177 [Colocasia esculenta]|uniref:Uncharacterized protein n=1 Tax=Colocasia esculenta TaxID=4460 RepID=A0A843T683_COLES|nr:hypothetical protein [Colocasia esculenta]
MVSGSERSSRDGSRLRRHQTLSVPLPPTSEVIPPPPTSQGLPPAPTSLELPLPLTLQQIAPSSSPRGSSAASTSSVVHLHRLHHLGGGALAVEGPLGELQKGGSLMDNNGMSPSSEDMAWALLLITLRVAWALYQKCIWERIEKTDREMLAHMSSIHRSRRSKQQKRHFNGKYFYDANASVPAGVDSSDWQSMCEMWTTGDERSNMQGRTPHRLEVFKMGRCKDLPDGSESWVDEESRRRYEAMTQMIAPSSDIDAESHTPTTLEDAFILVMEKDRPGHVHCVATKVDEMSILLSQIQASQARTQHVPLAIQSESDSETDEAADDYSDHDDHVS